MTFDESMKAFRMWQLSNPDWQLICDIDNTDELYVQFNELPKAERMQWIGKYKSAARKAFDEYAIKRCKVPCGVIDADMVFHEIHDWPHGNAMMVFRLVQQ